MKGLSGTNPIVLMVMPARHLTMRLDQTANLGASTAQMLHLDRPWRHREPCERVTTNTEGVLHAMLRWAFQGSRSGMLRSAFGLIGLHQVGQQASKRINVVWNPAITSPTFSFVKRLRERAEEIFLYVDRSFTRNRDLNHEKRVLT